MPLPEPLRGEVRRVAVFTHGQAGTIGDGLARARAVADRLGVTLLHAEEERLKHGLDADGDDLAEVDLALVLGGDGTMLRTLGRFLETRVPVLGVNYGRVGFLTSISRLSLEDGLARAFAGEVDVLELPTLDVAAGGELRAAVNDVVATSATLGRIVELEWQMGDEELGSQACDGMVFAAPAGSTAYNLSNGGPVLVWGVDAMAVTFLAPHALRVRPLVAPRGRPITIRNRTTDVDVAVLADGHRFADLGSGDTLTVSLGERFSRLAVLRGTTFFRRYHEVFFPENAAPRGTA
ncbi:MAG: NAD(+)/NADH kinase [Gaiellaceae bacterium]